MRHGLKIVALTVGDAPAVTLQLPSDLVDRVVVLSRKRNPGARVLMVELEDAPPKGGELAKLAGRLCASSDFRRWIGAEDTDAARKYILTTCNITSRAYLDHNADAANIFHKKIRKPFSDFIYRIDLNE